MRFFILMMALCQAPMIFGADATVLNEILARYQDRLPQGMSVKFSESADSNPERFSVTNAEEGMVVISGSTVKARVFGLGKLLREPSFRGVCAPEKPIRGIYFATHFGNWYDTAPEEELSRYVEEMALWGCNMVRVWLDLHTFTGPDDPRLKQKVRRLKTIMKAAERCGLEIAMTGLSNEGFSTTPEELKADWHGGKNGYIYDLCGHYHVEICPSVPGGEELILRNREQVYDMFKDIAIGNVQAAPYDQGGCTCDKCTPWGANGYLRLMEKISALAKRKFPGCKVTLSLWRFDEFGPSLGEWAELRRRGNGLRRFFDRLMVESPASLKKGIPGGLPTCAMTEISMVGMLPWGGYGANPRPKYCKKESDMGRQLLAGLYPYSEGLYEDMNKIFCLQFAWNPNISWQKAVENYAKWYFGKDTGGDIVRATELLESNLGHEVEIHQNGKVYGVYNAVQIDRTRPYRFVMNKKNRPDKERALQADSCLAAAERKMDSARKLDWRWRILRLRANIDIWLADGADLDRPDVAEAMKALSDIYCVTGETRMFVAPPLSLNK